jgi:hypothetical protein
MRFTTRRLLTVKPVKYPQPKNYTERYLTKTERFHEFVKHSDIAFLDAHGVGNGEHFTVPHNMYIIFMSRPGQLLESSLSGFKNLLMNKTMARQFLQYGETSYMGFQDGWDWRKHLYAPGSRCPDLDIDTMEQGLGIWLNRHLVFKNMDTKLSVISFTEPTVLFVGACREGLANNANLNAAKNLASRKRVRS